MNDERKYMKCDEFKVEKLDVLLGDRHGKSTMDMLYTNPDFTSGSVALVTPACQTFWPRCTGDGNLGTMFGPSDPQKAKFTLDLNDAPINGHENEGFKQMAGLIERIDDKLLDFVCKNQVRILGRKELGRDEVKMLQIRSVRPKYDKMSGALVGHSLTVSTPKFCSNGMGGSFRKHINVCDHTGVVIPDGKVGPGDIVAATVYISSVYTGVGGDKFGISWGFDSVSVICQRQMLMWKSTVPEFSSQTYDFAKAYVPPDTVQFSEMLVE